MFRFPLSTVCSSSSGGGGHEWFSTLGFFGWKGACAKIGFGASKGSGSLANGGGWRIGAADGLLAAIGFVGDTGTVFGCETLDGGTVLGWTGAAAFGGAGAAAFAGAVVVAFGGAGAAAFGWAEAAAGFGWKI